MRFSLTFLLSAGLASAALGLPAPTEYTMDMFSADLRAAHLVAQVRVLSLDTSGTMEQVVLKVLRVYKGGLNATDSLIRDSRNVQMVGWYEPGYAVGQRSIVCCSDAARDGVNLKVNTRGKYTIGNADSVQPPPVGYGFAAGFAGRELLTSFEDLLATVIIDNGFLQFAPVLPRSNQAIAFRTMTTLGGGDVINRVTAELVPATSTIEFTFTYTPCTGVCPFSLMFVDTSATLASLPAGDYTAYRYMVNTLINAPFTPPDDSVAFTVYAVSSVQDLRRAVPAGRATRAQSRVFDCGGRAMAAGRAGLPPGLYIDAGRMSLQPAR